VSFSLVINIYLIISSLFKSTVNVAFWVLELLEKSTCLLESTVVVIVDEV